MPQDQRALSDTSYALYPPLEPYDAGLLDLDKPHRMYYEQSGNRRGVPVVFPDGLTFDGSAFGTAVTCLAFAQLPTSASAEAGLASPTGFEPVSPP